MTQVLKVMFGFLGFSKIWGGVPSGSPNCKVIGVYQTSRSPPFHGNISGLFKRLGFSGGRVVCSGFGFQAHGV